MTLLTGLQEEHLACKKLSQGQGASMVMCLEQDSNDLHLVQLTLLPPHLLQKLLDCNLTYLIEIPL